ncbi:hypothetical protein [Desulfobaculum bizertense]|uniref:NitT/TauT family transport system substrate-binding protein n=1 Tax=Desulfobaculum bizertense DSM 18034 TaxID=1121442 RepID=A0A1T4VSS1_9BACT|nr:hypothetical protein [Desulfobaculum bizertense]SKA68042.1 NitT/TauT family transport system substrate-binding protein [Desulfobaculum bizertense DSM 18034]
MFSAGARTHSILMVFALGIFFLFSSPQQSWSTELPEITFYTNGQATTPQLALWYGISKGELDDLCTIHIKQWKDMNHLRGLVLAGKGDLWLGHVDAFSQAARRGAPVSLLAVTGWRKFFFLSGNSSLRTLTDLQKLPAKTRVHSAPPDSPAVPVLQSLAQSTESLPAFSYTPHPGRALALDAIKHPEQLYLLPEPLVTVLLLKAPQLHVVGSVEELYASATGKEPFLPWAGLAMNTASMAKHPRIAARILHIVDKSTAKLQPTPEKALTALPKEFGRFVSPKIIAASLSRDILRAKSGQAARTDIEDLERLTARGMQLPALPSSFFYPPVEN